jgi:hypothetical protein
MRVLTPADDVVDAEEVEDPAHFPKIAEIPRSAVSFAISSGVSTPPAEEHWDNPECRPFGRYEISAPGAFACTRACVGQAARASER